MKTIRFIRQIVAEVIAVFQPLADAFENVAAFDGLLNDLGWELDDSATIENVRSAFPDLKASLGELQPLREKLVQDDFALQSIQETIRAVKPLLRKTRESLNLATDSLQFAPFNNEQFHKTFGSEVMQYLLYRYVEQRSPSLHGILRFLGVFESGEPVTDRDRTYIPYYVKWERLIKFAQAPGDMLNEVYGWNRPEFATQHTKLIEALITLLGSFSLPVMAGSPPQEDLVRYFAQADPSRSDIQAVEATLYQQIVETKTSLQLINLSLFAMPIPLKGTTDPSGIVLFPVLMGSVEAENFEVSNTTSISLKGDFHSSQFVRLEIYPDKVNIKADGKGSVTLAALLQINFARDNPWRLLGSEDTTRIDLHKAHAIIEAKGELNEIGELKDKGEVVIAVAADDLRLIIDMGDADGFLQKYLGDGERTFTFACGLQWSSRTGFGFSFGGSTKLEAILPIRQTIANIVDIERIHLGLSEIAGQNAIRLVAAFSGGLRLGPVQLVIDQVGMQADLIVHQDKFAGLFGALDFDFGFKPPTSVGVTIDADIIRGGGFLSFDRENEQYAGVVQLEIEGLLSLKGIGLITTHMPDGSKGFSLLIIITAEFNPIQLGYGFTLNGVGGLLGLNRTMQIDGLRNTLYAGGIDSLLFPQDPVANALRIVSDIQKFFPPAEGRFLVALMARIGWGSPESILTIDLGIIFEFPEPIRVALIGRLRIGLPTLSEAKPLILLQVDFLGVLDLAEQEVAIDATLHHSYITSFPISGDMALRLRWGKQASFALSVGGFHPRFVPPSGFPALRRMTMSLASGNPRITVEGYLAVTTNTVQIGGAISLYYKKKFDLGVTDTKVRVSAGLYFDALIQFDPFHFEVEIGGYAEIETDFGDMSVSVTLSVSGPQPWHVSGKARIKVCGHKLKVRFSHTLGDETNTAARLPVDPQTLTNLLLAELGKVKNWRSELPSNEQPLLLFAKPTTPTQTDTIYIHPFADLIFQQRVVPFETELSQFGNQPLSGKTTYQLTFSLPDGQDRLETKQVDELFATAQFKQMSDEQKLTSPAFTTMTGGYELGASEFDFDNEGFVTDRVTFETIVVGGEQNCPAPEPPHAELITQIFANSAVGQLSRKFGATGRKDVTWTPQIKVKLP